MSKRTPGVVAAVALACVMLMPPRGVFAANFADVTPSPQQVRWEDLEFGVIVHFGPNTFMDREWGDGTASPAVFTPEALDPDQWVQAAKAAGARYLVMVAKHHDGFCLWPTDQTDYSVRGSPWKNGKGDVVGEAAAAARKHGLQFGVYLSPWDRHDPRYADPKTYNRYYESELEELAQRYGELVEFWLDGAGSEGHVYDFPRFIETLRTYQPNTLVFADVGLFDYGDIRWVGNEEGVVRGENWNVVDRHGILRWRPAEVDTPLHRLHWFWHPGDESSLKTVDELMQAYENSVGRGGQLMLGIAPDRQGLLPGSDVDRLREFGEAIHKRYGNNLMKEHRAGSDSDLERALDDDPDTFWSAPAGSHHATLEVQFDRPIQFDRAVTMEWLETGQRVRQYRIDAWIGTGWKPLAQAQAIGHKKIDAFPPVTTDRVRLNLLATTDAAQIREFALYNSQASATVTR
jgi:alpha-L-fucosidase